MILALGAAPVRNGMPSSLVIAVAVPVRVVLVVRKGWNWNASRDYTLSHTRKLTVDDGQQNNLKLVRNGVVPRVVFKLAVEL